MKIALRYILFFFLLATPLTARSQNTAGDTVMPKPKYNLYSYLSSNLTYPNKARRKGIEGEVVVSFVVDTDGSIRNAYISRSLGGGCDEEALKGIKNMPPWEPGTIGGKPVKVTYSQPVSFLLEGGKEFKGSGNGTDGSNSRRSSGDHRVMKEVDVRRK